MIKNIIFDMGGVLIDWAPLHLILNSGVDKQDSDILLKELFKEVEWVALDAGTISYEEAFASVSKRIPDRLHDHLKFLIEKWWTLPFVYKEGMDDLIQELFENGYKIYLLSNASIDQKNYFERLPSNKCFSGRVTSAEIKMLKPHHQIYEYICNKYDLNKDECYFIDDSSSNVYSAIQYGFKASVFFDCERLRKNMSLAGISLKG